MDYRIGIDIGGTNTVIGLVDSFGNIKTQKQFSTKDYSDISLFIEKLSDIIYQIYNTLSKEDIFKGVGVGAPNGNYYSGTIALAPNLPFKGIIYLKRDLTNALQNKGLICKVVVDNDANAAALGEKLYGKAKEIKDFVLITLGTGVGSGIVVDNHLLYGSTGFAGEIGHCIVIPNGRECNCGRKGCLERYASATGIVITAKELLDKDNTPSLLRNYDRDLLTAKDISVCALQKDNIALQCYDLTAKVLALGLANSANILSMQKIYLFGGLAQSGDLLLLPLKKYFNSMLYPVLRGSIDIEISGLENSNAAILGSAALC